MPDLPDGSPGPEDDAVSDRAAARRVVLLAPLVDALESFRIRFGDPRAEEERDRLVRRLGHAVVPRLRDPDGPLVVALVGQTGSGKSTLLNSLAHRSVSPTGVVRPVTTGAVVWAGSRLPEPVLGLLERVPADLADDGRPPPDGLVVVDTPDPAIGEGRSIAEAVLDVADVCVFVASAARYADAGAWSLLDVAATRGMPTVFALNRLRGSTDEQGEVVEDFIRRLDERGLVEHRAAEAVVTVAEGPRSKATDGLPHDWVSGFRKEIEAFADPMVRTEIVDQATERALAVAPTALGRVRAALVEEAAARARLLDPVTIAVEDAATGLATDLDTGSLAGIGPTGERLAADLAAVVTRRAGSVARMVATAWEADPDGRRVLEAAPGLWTHGDGLVERTRSAVMAWSADLPALVAQAAGRRTTRRRTLRDAASAVERMAVDPSWRPDRRSTRRVLGRAPGLVATARGLLADALGAELRTDAERFGEAVGGPLPDGLAERLRLETP